MPSLLRFFPLLLLFACETTSVSFDQCDVALSATSDTVYVGDVLTITGGPQSEPFDTVVHIGDQDAPIVGITRTDCTLCDACRTNTCGGLCATCPECEPSCGQCEELLEVEIPDLPPGEMPLVLTNRFGVSAPIPVNVGALEDTDTDEDTDSDTDTVAN